MNDDDSFEQNQEFEYAGKKYVRVLTKRFYKDSEYSDGTMAPESGTYMWAEVQPIKWKIKNWDELPRSINPKGRGTAKTIYVKSKEAIMSGIPFYPNGRTKYNTMWQNSVLRAFLNGYDLHEELNKGNGIKGYKSDMNFNFKGKGFLQEAFNGISLQLEAQDEVIKEASDISLISMEEFIAAAKSKGVKEAIEHVSEELISGNDKEKYIDFLYDQTNFNELLKRIDLTTGFKQKLVLTLAEIKVKEEFEAVCKKKGIKHNDEISEDLENANKKKMAKAAAKIDLKAKKDRKKTIKDFKNIKL